MCISIQYLLNKFRLPGESLIILLYSLYIFLNPKTVNIIIKRCNWIYLIVAILISSSLSIFVCYHECLLGVTLRQWCAYFAAIPIAIALMKLGETIESNSLVIFLSSTSYEIYLVHHVMCSVVLSVIFLTNCVVLNYLILLLSSIFLAWILKQLGDKMYYKITKLLPNEN